MAVHSTLKMHDARPGGITLVCSLVVTGAIIDLLSAQHVFADYDTTQWLQLNPQAARIEEFFSYLHAGVSLLCAYFMLQAKNWARTLYVTWNGLKILAAGLLLAVSHLPLEAKFLQFQVSMIPGMVFFVVALFVLWRAEAREYFALGGHRRREED
jgi:hypothetical protein